MRYTTRGWVEVRHPERDIEERIAAHYAAQPDTVTVTRQYRLPDGGIPDILIETYLGEDEPILNTVIECKATYASMAALRQLHRYLIGLRDVLESWRVDYELAGLIAAPRFTKELQQYEEQAEIHGVPIRLWQIAP